MSTEQDEAAIRRIVADVQTAFNTNDADLLTKHFATDATVVTATGTRITGRDALLRANREGLAGILRDQHARYDVTDIRFLRPDVALAYKRATAITEDEPIDLDHSMVALYVLVKDDGRWRIAARQNTLAPR
ncbi:MAG: SgcJ/EcaC family oxidoreductase [Actinophytocola sp.]|uniref:SgcJ/EcaC family oxidoreductase n=1 Tax=Actinophytocola sp. TaxID=1872138 RepID=UPI00132ADF2A|nr:SgcJ/EcaC family oxidoreductase [Actinophytocola sp.]MPZ80775.1 SgcJ/EcaC family oxidoreductase [Actinophytocola sp.]